MSKVILVTGGSKGIGANIVEGLARKGYTVILNYNNSEKEAKSIQNALNKENIKRLFYKSTTSVNFHRDVKS